MSSCGSDQASPKHRYLTLRSLYNLWPKGAGEAVGPGVGGDAAEEEGRAAGAATDDLSDEAITRELVIHNIILTLHRASSSSLPSLPPLLPPSLSCPPSLPFSTQCALNGVNYDKLLQNGRNENVAQMEIFFFGFPRIVGLHYFPNLSVLRVVNQPIRSLSGLEGCGNLRELWVCEGGVKVRCVCGE